MKVYKDRFMKAALSEAEKSRREDGIPIGSVLVKEGIILGTGHNKRVQENDPIMHAEIDCLRAAGRIRSYRGSVLYSTLMPCFLCAGAVVQFRIEKVVVGEAETFAGARELMESHGVEVVNLDLDECKLMMRQFMKDNPDLWKEDVGQL